LPSSSSHALIGGLGGAAIAGGATVNWSTIEQKVLVPMVASPLVGFAAAFLLMLAFMWVLRRANPHKVQRGFRYAQTLSAAGLALGHGLQDAQKTMGVIFLALVTSGHIKDPNASLPLWVVLAAASAISLGTYSGGWRIMRTLGRKIIDLDPPRGFAAESVATGVLYVMAIHFKAPISTTHTITSAIMGAGATKRASAVRWGVARNIVTAWVLTFPAAGLAAAVVYLVLRLLQLP
jgi:PiT family inorganic phosphate transporter